MTSVSAGHIILTPTQPVGSGRPQRVLVLKKISSRCRSSIGDPKVMVAPCSVVIEVVAVLKVRSTLKHAKNGQARPQGKMAIKCSNIFDYK